MQISTALLIIILLFSKSALADNASAFSEGTQFGKNGVGNTKGQITPGNASNSVPNYSSTNSASNYYLDGKGSLTAPASSDVTNCTTTPGTTDADAHTHGKCEGVRMLMSDPGKKNLMFPLNKSTDPLFLERNHVRSNPDTYLGSLNTSGNYANCVDRVVNQPNTYSEEVCNQYVKREEKQCTEQLTVTVRSQESCIPNTWYASNYTTFNNRANNKLIVSAKCASLLNGWVLTLQLSAVGAGSCGPTSHTFNVNPYQVINNLPVPAVSVLKPDFYGVSGRCAIPIDSIIYSHNGCPSDNCSTTVSFRRNYQVCTGGYFNIPVTCTNNTQVLGTTTLNYRPYEIHYTYTDIWDDQCASYKARLP